MKRNICADTDHEVVFDGNVLLSEQMELLLNATPAEIKNIHFLKLKLNAKKKSTVQHNQFQRVSQQQDGEELRGQPVGGGVPFSRSISTHFPSSLKSTSCSPQEYAATAVPLTDVGNFALGKSEPSRPPVPLNAPSSAAASFRGSLTRPPISTVVKEDPRDPVRRISMDELPASVALRRTLSGGLPTASPALFEAGNPPNDGSGGGAPLPLEPCPHCARTFAVESLKRHVETCRRHHESVAKSGGGGGGGGASHAKLRMSFPSSDASVQARLDTSKSFDGVERMGYE